MSLKQILWSFGIVLGAFALIIFGLYWWKLGPISTDHAAWSSFGSLLSGVFTIVGAGATMGTLLFLGKQNDAKRGQIYFPTPLLKMDPSPFFPETDRSRASGKRIRLHAQLPTKWGSTFAHLWSFCHHGRFSSRGTTAMGDDIVPSFKLIFTMKF